MRSMRFIKTVFTLALVLLTGFSLLMEESEGKRYRGKSEQSKGEAFATPKRIKPLTRQEFRQVRWMEEALFSTTYQQEPLGQRLSRLEDSVYGEVLFSLSPTERIKTLHFTLIERQRVAHVKKETLEPKNNKVKVIKSGKSPQNLEEDSVVAKQKALEKKALEEKKSERIGAGESDYPIVAILENKVFGRTEPQRDLAKRLDGLESQVFGRPQRGPYSARVDNLRLVVLGDTGGAMSSSSYPSGNEQSSQRPQNTSYFPGIPPLRSHFPYQNQGSRRGGSSPVFVTHGQAPPMPGAQKGIQNSHAKGVTFDASLVQAEQAVLQQSFPMELTNHRLNRLEEALFGRVAPPEVSEQDRLDRVLAVASAEGQATSDRDPLLSTPGNPAAPTGSAKGGVKSLWPFIPIIILMLL